MQFGRIIILIATFTFGVVAVVPPAAAADAPLRLKSSGVLFSFDGFLGARLVWEENGNTAACYGTITLADKPRYTYFLLLKVDPKKDESHSLMTKKDAAFGPDGGNLPLVVKLREATFEFTYKFQADRKAGTIRESIKIGEKEYDKDVP